jgi:hypothetical protein
MTGARLDQPVFPDVLGGFRDPANVRRELREARGDGAFAWITSHTFRKYRGTRRGNGCAHRGIKAGFRMGNEGGSAAERPLTRGLCAMRDLNPQPAENPPLPRSPERVGADCASSWRNGLRSEEPGKRVGGLIRPDGVG